MQVQSLHDMIGSQMSSEQLAELQKHADQLHARTHEVEAEIRAGLVRYASVLCSCPVRFTSFTMSKPPATTDCVIHGQSWFLFGPQHGCEHDG